MIKKVLVILLLSSVMPLLKAADTKINAAEIARQKQQTLSNGYAEDNSLQKPAPNVTVEDELVGAPDPCDDITSSEKTVITEPKPLKPIDDRTGRQRFEDVQKEKQAAINKTGQKASASDFTQVVADGVRGGSRTYQTPQTRNTFNDLQLNGTQITADKVNLSVTTTSRRRNTAIPTDPVDSIVQIPVNILADAPGNIEEGVGRVIGNLAATATANFLLPAWERFGKLLPTAKEQQVEQLKKNAEIVEGAINRHNNVLNFALVPKKRLMLADQKDAMDPAVYAAVDESLKKASENAGYILLADAVQFEKETDEFAARAKRELQARNLLAKVTPSVAVATGVGPVKPGFIQPSIPVKPATDQFE